MIPARRTESIDRVISVLALALAVIAAVGGILLIFKLSAPGCGL